MAQMRVVSGDLIGNLERVREMVRDAAKESCDVVVLPECCDVGWTSADAVSLSTPIPGRTSEIYAEMARAEQIVVVAGVTERHGGLTYNSAVIVDEKGSLLLTYRKINELSFARKIYTTGTRIQTLDILGTRVGLNICADNGSDSLELAGSLGRMGARLILSPCAWAVPDEHDNSETPYGSMWERTYGEIALKYDMPIVGVSGVGSLAGGDWDGWKCIGCSLAVDRTGAVARRLSYGVRATEMGVVDLEVGT
jgi:predicted amidohydrolase